MFAVRRKRDSMGLLSIAFAANGKREIQVVKFSQWEMST